MRATTTAILAALGLLAGAGEVSACGTLGHVCAPRVLVWPLYTLSGGPLGTIEAAVPVEPRLEISRFTGQPVTVITNDPTSLPGAVDPDLHLVPLPRAGRSRTVGAYPVGY